MTPETTKPGIDISIENVKIPTESSKGTPKKDEYVCALWVFQNCAGDKEKKLKRIVSLVKKRNSINWLPVTTDGQICIVTYLGTYNNLIKLRSSVFGIGMESFGFIVDGFWITPPKDISQFSTYFQIIKSDLQAREKRLLQQREMEIKSKSVKVSTSDFSESDDVELTEKDIEDLRNELDAVSSL